MSTIIEPLLTEDPERYTLFPIKYKDLYDFATTAENAFWVTDDVDMVKDVMQWPTLREAERKFISFILAFFAGAEGSVIDNLIKRFHGDVEAEEAKQFYEIQVGVEAIHKKQYNLMINSLIPDETEQRKLFSSIKTVPCIRAKNDWAAKYINSSLSFGERVIAFAAVEQIFFSGSFAAIYWVKVHLKKLPGLCHANELISRDEGLHCDFAILLYNDHIINKTPISKIQEIIRGAAEIEKNFVRESLNVRLVGMSPELMCRYVDYVADRLLLRLKQPFNKDGSLVDNYLADRRLLPTDPEKDQRKPVPVIYGAKNPFAFMRFMSAPYKSNFFEREPSDYQRGTNKRAENTPVVNGTVVAVEDENW